MELHTDIAGDVAVIRLTGRLTMVSAPRLRQAVTDIVAGGCCRLVLDLAGCEFIDSSGLGALIAGLKTTRQAGGDLRIAQVAPQVMTVLQLTNLDRVLRTYPSVDRALGVR